MRRQARPQANIRSKADIGARVHPWAHGNVLDRGASFWHTAVYEIVALYRFGGFSAGVSLCRPKGDLSSFLKESP
jgi:hypothetical protein